jgi:hypothetical protein
MMRQRQSAASQRNLRADDAVTRQFMEISVENMCIDPPLPAKSRPDAVEFRHDDLQDQYRMLKRRVIAVTGDDAVGTGAGAGRPQLLPDRPEVRRNRRSVRGRKAGLPFPGGRIGSICS